MDAITLSEWVRIKVNFLIVSIQMAGLLDTHSISPHFFDTSRRSIQRGKEKDRQLLLHSYPQLPDEMPSLR